MARIHQYFIASLLCLLFLSCYDTQVSVDHLRGPTTRTITSDRDTSWFRFNKDYFPHGIGTQWTYLLHDSASARTDSILLTVVSDSFGNNGRSYLIEMRVRGYVLNVHDGIGFDGESGTDWGYGTTFDFPLSVGKNWGWATWSRFDSAWVVGESTIAVGAGTFDTAFHVVEMWDNGVGFIDSESWFVPHIGIAKLEERIRLTPNPQTRCWELVRYSKPAPRTH